MTSHKNNGIIKLFSCNKQDQRRQIQNIEHKIVIVNVIQSNSIGEELKWKQIETKHDKTGQKQLNQMIVTL